ncbi:hypothetical protein D1AOALGA4SA_2935 [Olavius algarvensis Delta 1 endosymbiont]|nr:hypothetical protein D1AOALGA4SA_2935 [Olavius algarvensis Delta 1 endosymbiont]
MDCGFVVSLRSIIFYSGIENMVFWTRIFTFINIEPAHKLKIDQNKLQNCRSNILNLVNVL